MAEVRKVPGWFPSLVRAECDGCGWLGPTRDLNDGKPRVLARLDADQHNQSEHAP